MIYFDHAASSPIYPELIDLMATQARENYANPSALHPLGQRAKLVLETAREFFSSYLSARPLEIYFCSSGTEANNLILKGFISAQKDKIHVISSPMEHPAVLRCLEHYADANQIDLSLVKHRSDGRIDLENLESLIQSNSKLISLMAVNNELGCINPFRHIGELCKRHGIFYHCDAVQAFGKIDFHLQNDAIDGLTASAHKIHGPKGAALAYIRKGIKITKQIHGGAQEFDLRAGTENYTAISSFAKALEIYLARRNEGEQKIRNLKNYMIQALRKSNLDYQINGDGPDNLPHIINVSFPPLSADALVIQLGNHDICVSAGSACSSGALKVSHVLQALDTREVYKKSAIRFSFSEWNQSEEIDACIIALEKIMRRKTTEFY